LASEINGAGQGRVGVEETEISGDAVHNPVHAPYSSDRPRNSVCSPLSIGDLGDVKVVRRFDEETNRIHREGMVKSGGGGSELVQCPGLRVIARILLCRTRGTFLRAEKDPMSMYMEAAIQCIRF